MNALQFTRARQGLTDRETAASKCLADRLHFCPRCGSSLFSQFADEIEVHLGTLDSPSQFEPSYECWTVRREAWLPPFPLEKSYRHDREGGGREEN